jgi:acetoacetyl-CoA synthetase
MQSTRMWHFARWMEARSGQTFSTYDALWQYSIREPESLWRAIWDYFEVAADGKPDRVLVRGENGVMGAKWFPDTRLSYSEMVFQQANDTYPALVYAAEQQEVREMSWQELQQQVERLAQALIHMGVEAGDRVAAYVLNTPAAVVAFLAANSLGAVWSSCSPDFGPDSVIDRFAQIEPKVFFAVGTYSYNGKTYDRRADALHIASALPGLQHMVWIGEEQGEKSPDLPFAISHFNEHLARPTNRSLTFLRVPFDHPIWILYSSGTTGKPKAITHGTGGMLLEHLKALALHQNVQPGDRFFWYSTTGWMMWNYLIGDLLVGGTAVLYDGAAAWPHMDRLWQLAANARITHFGGGAAYYIACMKHGEPVIPSNGLPDLQSVGSTGSPLPPDAFDWLYANVKSDLWLISLSGGTDVCSGFVGGSPLLPMYRGEIQCRMLGCDVQAWNEQGEAVTESLGELVIATPMPSMPVFFWNDPGDVRYRSSYFEHFPGVWRHGDWVRITDRGGVVIYGRSDATLNRGGVRIGTAEVYNAVEGIPEIRDSLVLSLELPGGQYLMPLFVVLAEGITLTDELKKRINARLREKYSPRHVPDEIIAAPAIPYTISGKKMEAPVKKILMGMDPGEAATPGAMKNPESLAFFAGWRR